LNFNMLLKVTKSEYIDNYKIYFEFNNGVSGIIDFREKVFSDHREVVKALQSLELFKDFSLNRWTIEWKNGVDLAPEYLYELMLSQRESVASTN